MKVPEEMKELTDALDIRYMQKSECAEIQDENQQKFSNDNTSIKLLQQKIEGWEWLFKLIATGTIGTLATSILALILK